MYNNFTRIYVDGRWVCDDERRTTDTRLERDALVSVSNDGV